MTTTLLSRDMTMQERVLFYKDLVMPCGHGPEYYQGPEGGIMMNITCPTCGLKLNVVTPGSGHRFEPRDAPGEVLWSPPDYAPTTRPSLLDRMLKKFGLG